MPLTIVDLLARLQPDPWRQDVGFTPEIAEANQRLFDNTKSTKDLEEIIGGFIQRHQPCLFGRIAAKCDFLSYCILTERDLQETDEYIQDKIQASRTAWTKAAYDGNKSGFIILAISEKLAEALPDPTVKKLALRLCSLYLLNDIVPDDAFLDEIWLEKPGLNRTTWRWQAGINYFSAQGDKRWWHDHRIPGGMAFSVNSVGHMVKSAILSRAMATLGQELDAPEEGWALSKVDSLSKAHVLAMQTISKASKGVSGQATELLSLPEGGSACCPAELPISLADKDCSEYLGKYHTDYTIPSEYFRADVQRPSDLDSHILDFTYLFHRSVENPAFIEMGEGKLIREDEKTAAIHGADLVPTHRISKMAGQEVLIDDYPRLRAAIS